MKHILKQPEPQQFRDWKLLKNEDWQPSWDNLSGPVKENLRNSLRTEQGDICCYCERRLSDSDLHIEHLQPQSDSAVDPLEYANLLCSCQSNLKKGEPRHCGNLKGSWYDAHLLVSPLDPMCEQRFSYTADGAMRPTNEDDSGAAETIMRLGLDIPKLKDLRAKTIEPFLAESLSPEELQTFVSGYLRKDTEGRYGEFWTTIRHVFEGYIVA